MMADSGDCVGEHVEERESSERLPPDTPSGDGPAQETQNIRIDQAHLDPSRWWFASSAFPMIAATLGPVASAFSICALVRPWRQSFPPGSDIAQAVFVEDPVWLTVINSIQLAVALIANLILLLNMARKIRFAIAQPITIVTWYMSSLLLIALGATAAGPLRIQPGSNYIWSQAFFYGIYAAVLYFICSSLMVVTFWGAQKGHYSKDFQLTTSQRTLMLQTIMFLIYLLVGALVFSKIEGWPYLDAVYWSDATLFTVGFGDFYPKTTLGRALLFPYALVGVISLGLVIGSIRSLVLDRGRRHLGARMVEKKRKRVLKRMVRRGKEDILIPVTDDEPGNEEDRIDAGLTEFERRRREFELMRKIQDVAERRRRWMAMGVSTTVWLILWLVGAAIFQQCEVAYQGWTYFDGFYFAFVGLTTIGYGDVTPISPAGKSFFVFWSLLALPTMTVLISNAGDTVVKFIREGTDWLGTVTILPSDRGFKKEFKLFMTALSLGKVFGDDSDVEESAPGFFGNVERHRDSSSEDDEEEEEDDSADKGEGTREKATREPDREMSDLDSMGERSMGGSEDITPVGQTPPPSSRSISEARTHSSPATGRANSNTRLTFSEPRGRPSPPSGRTGSSSLQRAISKGSSKSGKSRDRNTDVNSQTVDMSRAVSMARTSAEIPTEAPTNRHDYTIVLIDEINRVTQHLKSKPPRKYSFREWAWYLKLIGEDEANAETHQKPVPRSNSTDEAQKDRPEKLQWSWVGSRSPLMGSQEEAEWILEMLQKRLADELRSMRREMTSEERSSGDG